MSSVQQLAEGLVERCQTVAGLTCYPLIHPSPKVPALCVGGPIRWTYDESMDGLWRPVFELVLYVNSANIVTAQESILAYVAPSGAKSVPAAIYGDPTLGNVAHDTRVLGGSGPPLEVESASGKTVRCALEVEVTAQ